jgi:RNA polymerase sigma-70 factor (sigma-E family)
MVGSTDSFEDYLRARSGRLLRVAYLLTGGRGHAEDLLQTVLVKVWPRWNRVVSRGDPEAYLHRCLINAMLTARWRRRVAEVPLGDVDPGDGDRLNGAVETRLVVLQALARLPIRQRATVVLRHLEDLTEAEVAERMGCTVGTVKSQNAKALATLRHDLGLISLDERRSNRDR